MNFLMTPEMGKLTLVGLYLLMFSVHENFVIAKIEILNFCETERVKQNQKQIKIIQNQLRYYRNFKSNFNKIRIFL